MKKGAKWLIISAVGSLLSLGIGIASDIFASRAATAIDEEEQNKQFESKIQKYLEENNYVKGN